METTLFWIGCGLGVYAYFLRRFIKRPQWAGRKGAVTLLHTLFWTAGGAMVGFVISASVDLSGPSPAWPIRGAIVGFIGALIHCLRTKSGTKMFSELLMIDLEWAETSFSAFILAAVIMYAVIQAFKIPSGSMENTLLIGDHLFVNKFEYGIRIPLTEKRVLKWHDVRRRDVVVFEAPPPATVSAEEREHNVKKDFIKRAIGLPGDLIEVKDKHVYVNGQVQDEPYAIFRDPNVYPSAHIAKSSDEFQRLWETGNLAIYRREEIGDNFGPIRVPPHCYFVMGDNRDGSFDSRFWGPVPDRLLKGKAWIVYWPPSRIKVIR